MRANMNSKRSEIPVRCLRLFSLTVLLAVSAVLPGYAQSDYRQVNLSSPTDPAQPSEVRARVTQAVDVQNRVTLRGNIHPLARAEYDRGTAPDDLPMARMLLVLRRGEAQETALRQLLEDQQVKSSPHYHQWLTPEEFGQRFGPADVDIQAVTDWLTGQGFEVNQVAAGRTVIEFSGSAGLVRQGLHTEIHKFLINGKQHWANVSDPQIPAALAPVVAGIASLNNFPRKPQSRSLGAFSRSKLTGEVQPLFTVPTSLGNFYVLGPTDFATIYNLLSLWTAGTDGTGQTIAVVGQTNINVQDVRDFRSLFGLPANDPNIIVNGPDPGINRTEVEAVLDVEWSGAVARGATIDLVVSESTEATYGVDLSALYIIDNNLAPVMSESYGACEADLGTGGNAFYNTLWEQAAAQGITVVIASGDSGSATCDAYPETAAQYGLAVSGLASTPFNVAVGGTDFDDVNTWSTYWSTNNSSTWSSAKSYIPESTWNDSCARSGLSTSCASVSSDGSDLIAGGGGPSGVYAKPSWQSGAGVPNDSARDIPDLSLFAGDGFNRSFYVVCQADLLPPGYASCDPNAYEWSFVGGGGASASAQVFAGIMALVNQKTGVRQGNANFVLYPLAAKSGASCTSNATMAPGANTSSCIFYDVIKGNNSVACVGGSPNCSNTRTASGQYGIMVTPSSATTPAWTTNARYDLATGLGSVNVANLVNKWNLVSFTPSTTTLSLSTSPATNPVTLAHGQPVNVTINVAPKSGSGTPTGDVSLIAQTSNSQNISSTTGIGSLTLSGGSVSSTTNMLPGGSYNVIAHYAGNGTYGGSDSNAVPVTVSTESSLTKVGLVTYDPSTQVLTYGATSATYGSPYVLRVDVTNSGGTLCAPSQYPATGVPSYPCPTGTVTVTANGAPPPDQGAPSGTPGTYTLNSQGYAEDQYIQLPGGTYNLAASYAGDNSYNPSQSSAVAITITKAPTTTTLSAPSSVVGTSVDVTVTINTQSYGVGPTGTVQLLNNGAPIGVPVYVWGTPYSTSTGAYATATVVPYTSLPVGANRITAQYSGDSNYAGSTSAAATVTVTDFSLTADPPSIVLSNSIQSANTTLTITPLGGFTGSLFVNIGSSPFGMSCTVSPSSVDVTGPSAVTTTFTCNLTAPVAAAAPNPEPRVPPSFRPLTGWLWLLVGMLALATLVGLATARRHPAGWLFASVMLVVGLWAACGGAGGSGPPPAPLVSLSPASLSFGQEDAGSTSAPQSVTLSNTGTAVLRISNIDLGGVNPLDFAQTNNCGSGVVAGSNCTINVTFSPNAAGSRSASLAIFDDASGSPHAVSLTGSGAPGPTVSISPASLTFGPQGVSTTSPPQSVTLSNTGTALLSISSISAASGAGDFAQTNNCGSSLVAGANCAINVTFTPLATGPRAGTLVVADNVYGGPQRVGLSGTGGVRPGNYTVFVYSTVVGAYDTHVLQITVTVQ
jgi:subtilase family serine protease